VTANAFASTVSILLGQGDGHLGPTAPEVGVGGGPEQVAVADFDGDGHLDLVTANSRANTVSILLGQADGRFVALPVARVGRGPLSVAVADFNGDGRLDLVTANFEANTISILLGRGGGRFVAAPDVRVGVGPISVAVGDFNNDGHPDLATANFSPFGPNSVSILLGHGDGRFAAMPEVGLRANARSVAVGDFNSDGHVDLAVVNNGFLFNEPSTVLLLLGQGDGYFVAAPEVEVGGGVVAVGDFNGDGRPDLAVANGAANSVSILINSTVVQVNALITFVPIPATFRFTPHAMGCSAGFVGTFEFVARLTNRSDHPLTALVVQVTTLSNGTLLQNADGGPGGVGARLTVPRQDGFADGLLGPGEFVDVSFIMCLEEQVPFQFLVNVLGAAKTSE
jgi:hypothetical protein